MSKPLYNFIRVIISVNKEHNGNIFSFSYSQTQGTKTDLAIKPRIIIFIDFLLLESKMLPSSFKGIGQVVLEKKIFKVFTIYGHDSYLCHDIYFFPFARRLHMKFN